MSQADDDLTENVEGVHARKKTEAEAFAWLQARGQVTMRVSKLAREWGQHPTQAGRWLDYWAARKLIRRNGKTVTVIVSDAVKNTVTNTVNDSVKNGVTNGVTENAVVPVASRKLARPDTSAHRVVRRALAEPVEAVAPVVLVEAGGPVASARPWVPPRVLPPEAPSDWGRLALIAVLALISFGVIALALFINGQTGWHFGTSSLASMTFMGLAIAGDVLAFVLPATVVALWHGRRRRLASMALLTCVAVSMLAVLNTLGFVELHTTDTAAGRQAIVTTASASTDRRNATITAAQLALTTAAKQREAECAVRGARCRDREADERATLAALNAAVAVPIPAAATIADADPQITATLRLANWAGLKLTATDVVNLRLVLMALLPNIAGLVLAFAMGLARPQRR